MSTMLLGKQNGTAQAKAGIERFMPTYEVMHRHEIHVDAPPDLTWAAAYGLRMERSWLIRLIFAMRTWPARLRGTQSQPIEAGMIARMLCIGWGALAEEPGKRIVMGAVCQPWKREVVFKPLAPDAFASFNTPGYAKIVWTIEVDMAPDGTSIARTETRVVTTDPASRQRFRAYWSTVQPGVALIRRLALRMVKKEAERAVDTAA
jgi:hypothetical protein